VHVNEVSGDAYGYGGVTQNERYIAGKIRRAADVQVLETRSKVAVGER
jgi:hypothetical protein